MSAGLPPPPSPPHLDPPFRGYIETTYDSLLVFEAARRGMIPRVTRRLIERERGMVQSGAVFVFDEQESGIRRWTDGLVWSPSRILGNFLVYRETDKRPNNASGQSDSPGPGSSSGTPSRYVAMPNSSYAESSQMAMQQSTSGDIPILAQGAMRLRSDSEVGLDRQRERQLVGSLTNSYRFREGGLVKKTMSVNIGNYSQHMISYYTVEDVMSGKLRTPSTIPELAALEISVDYLQKQNFRFPPMVEVGIDGVPRYRGEAEEPMSPNTPMSSLSIGTFPNPSDVYDPYSAHISPHSQMQLPMEPPRHPHPRAVTHPQHIPLPLPSAHGHLVHGQTLSPSAYLLNSASGHYFDPAYSSSVPNTSSAQPIPIQRQVSAGGGPMRPSSSSRARYDPYNTSASPRVVSLGISAGPHGTPSQQASPINMHRRQSVPHPQSHQQQQQQDYYQQYDIKPIINASGNAQYAYQPPATAPGAFGEYHAGGGGGFGNPSSTPTPISAPVQVASPIIAYTPTPAGQQHYTAHSSWHSQSQPASSQSRLLPAQPRDYARSPMPPQLHLGGTSSAPVPIATSGEPPSSAGSSGSNNRPMSSGLPGGTDFAYGVAPLAPAPGTSQQPQQQDHPQHTSVNAWDQNDPVTVQTLGLGINHSASHSGAGAPGSGLTVGGMDMGQYVTEEWSGSSSVA